MRSVLRAPGAGPAAVLLAAGLALLAGGGPALAAVDRIENSRFVRLYGSAAAPEPLAFGRHLADERRTVAPRLGQASALRVSGRPVLLVERPLGDPRGVVYVSAPVRTPSGSSWLVVAGWLPLSGQAEAA